MPCFHTVWVVLSTMNFIKLCFSPPLCFENALEVACTIDMDVSLSVCLSVCSRRKICATCHPLMAFKIVEVCSTEIVSKYAYVF